MNTKSTNNEPCVCGSTKLAKQCCEPLLSGVSHAKTPLALMRSRYSAYASGSYGAYLVETWLPMLRASLNEYELSNSRQQWVRLEIMAKSQQGNKGFIEFKAYYLDDDLNECVHHEKSTFQRLSGRWYYSGVELPKDRKYL